MKGVLIDDSVRAVPSARALVQARNPQAVSALRASIDYRGTLRPTFTCRAVKPPHPRGHRQWLNLEARR